MLASVSDLWAVVSRRRVWIILGGQDIAIRYKRSIFGPFWISLTMAVFVLSLAFIYAEVFHMPFAAYLAYLACGLIAWNFISAMVTEGAMIVAEGENHLRNVALPVSVLSARMVFRNVVIFLHNLVAILIILALFGHPVTWTVLLAFLGLGVLSLFGLFAGIILGPLSARFRDVPQVISNVMQMLFFVTPIIWTPSAVSHRPALVALNPLNDMVMLIRQPLMGEAPDFRHVAASVLVVAAMGVLALMTLSFVRRRVFLWL